MINLYNVSFLSCNVHLIQLYHDETFSLHCIIITSTPGSNKCLLYQRNIYTNTDTQVYIKI